MPERGPHTYKIMAGACVIKETEGKRSVLILKQPDDSPEQPGKWAFPGGHGEGDELPAQTAKRELNEETGLDIQITGLIQVTILNEKHLIVVYAATAPHEAIQLSHESSQYHWITKEELESGAYPFRTDYVVEPIKKALTGEISPIGAFTVINTDSFYND